MPIVKCKKCRTQFMSIAKQTNCPDCRMPYGREDRGLKDILDSIKNKEQRKTLERWVNERLANGVLLKTAVTCLYTLRKIGGSLEKPFEKVTKEDLTKLFAQKEFNKYYYKKLIKTFFKWLYGTEEHPEVTKWIKLKKTLEETKPEKKVLTDQEILKIIQATYSQRDKTILQILVENPTRPRDICNLKIKDVLIDEYGFELQMGSKTPKGRRTIRLINSVPDLKLYLQNHPFKDNPEHPLFFSFSANGFGKPIGWSALNGMLQNAVKRSGVKRKVTLYDFRRTSTTKLLQDPNYTTAEVQLLGGWSSIQMLNVYGKVTSEMVGKKKLMVNGKIKSEEKGEEKLLKPITCPRCQELNSPTSVSCGKCWLPLKKKAINLKEKVIKKSIEWGRPLTEEGVFEILQSLEEKGKIKIN